MSTLEQVLIVAVIIVVFLTGILVGSAGRVADIVAASNFSFKDKHYKVVEVKKVVTYQDIASSPVTANDVHSGEK